MIGDLHRSGMIAAVSLRLSYLVRVLGPHTRSSPSLAIGF